MKQSSSAQPPPNSDSFAVIAQKTPREDLLICLSDLQSAGDVALFEPLPASILPGLWVKGVGTIGLPLSERDAQAIITAAHEAPYGKGSETLVDSNVRKTWELAPGDFQIRNPEWQTLLGGVLQKVCAGMGIQADKGGVKAELYKMLLYDEGAMFKPHQDSEKAQRMFGTLVICLPSKHKGGEVQLTHMGRTTTFETAKYSEFGASFMSWFSDVVHEIKPIKSGYRLVLTYNLCHSGSTQGSASAAVEASVRLFRIISSWTAAYNERKRNGVPKMLAYKLEHQYTNANLSFDALKGHDREVAKHLKAVCSQTGSHVYLADLEKMVLGGAEDEDHYDSYRRCYGDDSGSEDEHHSITEIYETYLRLPNLVDLSGAQIAENVQITEDQIIQENIFEDREPDEEDYEGFSGNAGASATHWYRDTVLIIIPKGARMPALLGELKKDGKNSTMKILFAELSRNLEIDQTNKDAETELIQMCNLVAAELRNDPAASIYHTSRQVSTEVVGLALETSVKLARKQIFIDILASESRFLSPSAPVTIGKAIALFGFDSIEPSLRAIVNRHSTFEGRAFLLDTIRRSFRASKLELLAVSTSKSEGSIPAASDAEPAKASEEGIENSGFYQWTTKRLKDALKECTMRSEGNGVMLLEVSVLFGPKFLYNDVLPRVKQNASSTEMVIAFANELLKAGETGRISNDVAVGVFRDVLQDMIDEFSLELSDEAKNKRQKTEPCGILPMTRRDTTLPSIPSEPPKESQNMAQLLGRCLTLGFDFAVDQLFTKIISGASNIPVELFHTHLFPFLKLTIHHLTTQNTDLTLPRFRLLFQHTLHIYIDRYVAPEPTPPKGWERPNPNPQNGCRCQNCRDLDIFLADPQRQTIHFSRKQSERTHLENRFGWKCDDRADFRLDTVRNGSPHTLIIMKRPGIPTSFKRLHKEWQDRCGVAIKFINDLGVDALRKLLGEQYADTINLVWVSSKYSPIAAESSRTLPLTSSMANIQAFGSRTVKSLTEDETGTLVPVIDLTGEV